MRGRSCGDQSEALCGFSLSTLTFSKRPPTSTMKYLGPGSTTQYGPE
jgi:hypothetical protein